MITVVVNVFEAAGLTVSEKKTETMLLRKSKQTPLPCHSSSKQQARDINRECSCCTWAALSTGPPTLCQENKRRVRRAWACFDRFKLELYDMEIASSTLKVGVLKSPTLWETLLCGCEVDSPRGEHRCAPLRAPQAPPSDHWLPSPTTHRPQHVGRQNPQKGTMQEH